MDRALRIIVLPLVAVSLQLIAVGCSNNGEIASQDLYEVEIGLASEFKFNPAVIELKAGQRVHLRFKNEGRLEHDIEILDIPATGIDRTGQMPGHGDFSVSAHALGGASSSVEFTPVVAGEYYFECTQPGHASAGMVGKVIVEA